MRTLEGGAAYLDVITTKLMNPSVVAPACGIDIAHLLTMDNVGATVEMVDEMKRMVHVVVDQVDALLPGGGGTGFTGHRRLWTR